MAKHANNGQPKMGPVAIGLLLGLGIFLGAVLGTWK